MAHLKSTRDRTTCLRFEAQNSVELYDDARFAVLVAVGVIVYPRAVSQPLELEPADLPLARVTVVGSSFFVFAGHT